MLGGTPLAAVSPQRTQQAAPAIGPLHGPIAVIFVNKVSSLRPATAGHRLWRAAARIL
jgi:hypothetical protein